MIARVRGVRTRSTAEADSQGRRTPAMSANTGVAPEWTTTAAVAANVSEGTTTSSPGRSRTAAQISCSAAVPLATAIACAVPTEAAKAASNSATAGPCESQPDRYAAATASTSASLKRTSLSGTAQSGIAPPPYEISSPCVDSWEGRQTLVTGAGGFIGGHLTVALNRAGARVRGLCRYNSRGDRGTLDWFDAADTDGVEVVHGELRDPESVARALRGIEVVFHLGAQIAIPYSFVNPRDFFETNVVGTLNVAQAALAAGAQRVLHVSTSEVYGDALQLADHDGPSARAALALRRQQGRCGQADGELSPLL